MTIELHDGSWAVLSGKAASTLIYVKEFAIHIESCEDGVEVHIYAKGQEYCTWLNEASALDIDAKRMQEEGL